MQYASKTRTLIVPVLHTERSKVDRVFITLWSLIGGSFVSVRVGIDCANWMAPKYCNVKKRVRVRANT
jgi:hypothetical protein